MTGRRSNNPILPAGGPRVRPRGRRLPLPAGGWLLDPLVVMAAAGTVITAVVGAGLKGVWRWGREVDVVVKAYERELKAAREDRDWWKRAALRGMGINEKAIDVAAKVVPDDGA